MTLLVPSKTCGTVGLPTLLEGSRDGVHPSAETHSYRSRDGSRRLYHESQHSCHGGPEGGEEPSDLRNAGVFPASIASFEGPGTPEEPLCCRGTRVLVATMKGNYRSSFTRMGSVWLRRGVRMSDYNIAPPNIFTLDLSGIGKNAIIQPALRNGRFLVAGHYTAPRCRVSQLLSAV